ncbi:MAG: DUF6498-containing protein [Deinococcota bacterium]
MDRIRLPKSASIVAVIAVNLFPLIGVIAFGWQLFTIILLYWLENAIIGMFNVLKMTVAQGSIGEKSFNIPFFIVHYGGFWIGHGIFLWLTFAPPAESRQGVVTDLRWVLLGLLLSHGISFVTQYLGEGEFRNAHVHVLLFLPYARVMTLHVAIIAGGFAIQAWGGQLVALGILVGSKTLIEAVLEARHLRQNIPA